MPKNIDIDGLVNELNTREGRVIVAIAGPPGVGKSTFSAALRDRLNACEILPMDGYHYDDLYLDGKGWRARKGALHTFDVAGFRAMLARLKANDEPEISVPVFDREIEIARAGARMISRSVKTILVEGNYLLLRSPPWGSLGQYFDMTIMLDAPKEVLKMRLANRWKNFGYSAQEAEDKIAENDLLNVSEVIDNSVQAQYVLDTG